MKRRFILYRRKLGGMFYIEDTQTKKQESLGTKDRTEAASLLNARNEAARQPQLNLQIAKAYLSGTDSGVSKRTWQDAFNAIIENKQGATKERWQRAVKQEAFGLILPLVIIETQAGQLFACLKAGTVSTNVHLRELHNFCIGMNWLAWPIIPKRLWPKIEYKPKRAITADEHQSIIEHESNPENRSFYELCWHLGGSQTDIANLVAEDIDWNDRVISYARRKTGSRAFVHFGPSVETILRSLPAQGFLFPRLAPMKEKFRGQEFKRRCVKVGIRDVTLHCYRYAWAERAKQCGYGYIANSPLVGNVWFTNNTTLRMTTTKSYDYLNRVTAISSAAGGSNVTVFNYANNAANQRTAITNVDSSRWIYQYDPLGQVVSGKKYWADGTPVAGQQFEYAFDDIGNRRSTAAGGDATGANQRYASYTNNTLNQITGRDVPGFVNVIGTASNTATVTLWGDNGSFSATLRKGEYFRGELAVTNTPNPVWLAITNLAVLTNGGNPDIVTNTIGKTYVAKTPELFCHDLDGNLTNDGRWTYTWDAENRLVKVESLSFAPAASKRKVTWEFDGKGRRIRQTTYEGSSGSYVATDDLKYLADGWRHVAELNATNNTLVRSYVWGLDLSGSLEGAGGVGGLLMINSITNSGHFYAYDGNGNVIALVKASDGTVSANYEYEAFGQVLRATGLMANENRFQFSTKRCDRSTDLQLYEYRVRRTDSSWLNRDPIGEEGGKNLYGFVANTPINAVDQLGLVIVGFYGFDKSYRWVNPGNQLMEEYSVTMEMFETVLRPRSPWRPYPLYPSRADGQAFSSLLQYLDTNRDGYYNPPCDNEETIKIFGWSWGGASAVELANRINTSRRFKKKNVGLVAVIDPVTTFRPGNHVVPSNVYRLWNRYQKNGGPVLAGFAIHGEQLKIADPSKTIANQLQLDPSGPNPAIDHVTIVQIVGQEFVAQFFQ